VFELRVKGAPSHRQAAVLEWRGTHQKRYFNASTLWRAKIRVSVHVVGEIR